MLLVGSALNGYAIKASDGIVGTVGDLLFDDRTWKLRWLVVDTGEWLTGRKVLIHPSAIGQVDYGRQELAVKLSKAQIDGGPEITQHQPVSLQMESELHHHYKWDPHWGTDCLGVGAITPPLQPPSSFRQAEKREPTVHHGDPHLRSLAAVKGYNVQATNGRIGHAEDFLIDDASWCIRFLVIDTRNWWPGQHVLISRDVVREISWSEHEIRIEVARDEVKASPPWDPVMMMDQFSGKRLHHHSNWPHDGSSEFAA